MNRSDFILGIRRRHYHYMVNRWVRLLPIEFEGVECGCRHPAGTLGKCPDEARWVVDEGDRSWHWCGILPEPPPELKVIP